MPAPKKRYSAWSGFTAGQTGGKAGALRKRAGYTGDCESCGHPFRGDEERYMDYTGGEHRICKECVRKQGQLNPNIKIYPTGARDDKWREHYDQSSKDPKRSFRYMKATNAVEAEDFDDPNNP